MNVWQMGMDGSAYAFILTQVLGTCVRARVYMCL